ncbi:DUF2336 domain-containing protein [Terasakiella sp. A23]|uniref:DUF2336 domain-containing protein n=1 Tax=Terasakiella sp. FCG-A23 TaxID=3080561 RepID=UPI00295523DF|nr:DUF2336 domain-containing protein [Terasakiella sp. A23]MDV7339136.1 DUF2336 domain-containing protein [Terasakiella sp. A23]
MASQKVLTEADVSKLLSNPSGEVRAETAAKIAGEFGVGLSESEQSIAEEIFRMMVKDAEVRVREALSENLKDNPSLPNDVAMSLAADVESVALPVLKFSDVLSEEDLMELVKTQGAEKQAAIATREHVSEGLSEVLVEHGNETVVASLVSNEGASISEQTFNKVVDDFGGSDLVQQGMVDRSRLPLTISERLVSVVSEKYRERLVSKHELSPNVATDLVLQSRERATLGLSEGSSDDDLDILVHSMNKNGRLTVSIILRSLCIGDVPFFEAALVEMAELPSENSRILLRDGGMKGVAGVYNATSLPDSVFPLIKVALDVAHENEYDGEENDRERYMRRTLERIMTQYEELGVDIDSDDLDYLMGKVNELPGALLMDQAG